MALLTAASGIGAGVSEPTGCVAVDLQHADQVHAVVAVENAVDA